MSLGRNFDSYYDPPEEPEIPICESCGHDMEENRDWDGVLDFRCRNQFCPAQFIDPLIKEMAEKLVGTLDTVSRLEGRVKHLTRLIRIYDPEYK